MSWEPTKGYRRMEPAAMLAEALQVFVACTHGGGSYAKPLWRLRLKDHDAVFGRAVFAELTPDLVFRVVAAGTGEVLAVCAGRQLEALKQRNESPATTVRANPTTEG